MVNLEQSRDAWINAYYLGHIDTLQIYEHEKFKVIFKKTGTIESNLLRYEKITSALKDGVWKPRKPDVSIEEFLYDYDNTSCDVIMKSENEEILIEELWVYEQGWKIKEMILK